MTQKNIIKNKDKGGKKNKMVKKTKKEKLKELLKKASTPKTEVEKEIEETNQMIQEAVDAGKAEMPELDVPKMLPKINAPEIPKAEKEAEELNDGEKKWIEDTIVKNLDREKVEQSLTDSKYQEDKIEKMLEYYDGLLEALEGGEESANEKKPTVEINPLSDDGLFRSEYLVRVDFQNQQLFKIAEALSKKK